MLNQFEYEDFITEYDESDERVRLFGRGRQPIRTPNAPAQPPSYTPQTGGRGSPFVTGQQLKEALDRVSKDVAANKNAIDSVTRQTNDAVQRLGQISSKLDSEVKSIRADLSKQSTSALMMTLLSANQNVVGPDGKTTVGKVDSGDSLWLPLLLTGGLGGGQGGAQNNGMDSTMLIVAMMMMDKNKNK